MTHLLEALAHSPLTLRLGWTLLHFLWQGAAVAALLALLLRLLAKNSSTARYLASTSALLLMVLLPLLTFQLLPAPPTTPQSPPLTVAQPPSAVILPPSQLPDEQIILLPGSKLAQSPHYQLAQPPLRVPTPSLSSRLQPLLPHLVTLWLLGVILLALYHLGGFIAIQRLKSLHTSPPTPLAQSLLLQLARRMNLSRPIQLLTSTLVQTPLALGYLRPVILLPASIISGLSPQQLEAILAHELAHIRRHDYLINLLQALVETLLFYHPAVWWVSQKIRHERENCCDDTAARLCGDPLLYAQALLSLEELRTPTPTLAMAATGGSMLTRIRRLLNLPPQTPSRKTRSLTAALIILSSLLLLFTVVKCAHPSASSSPPATVVDAPALVEEVRAKEKWIDSVASFHVKAESTWISSPDENKAAIAEWKKANPEKELNPKWFAPERTDTVELAYDPQRLSFHRSSPPVEDDWRVWDGNRGVWQVSNAVSNRNETSQHKDTKFVQYVEGEFSWPRAEQHQMWWEKQAGIPAYGVAAAASEFRQVRMTTFQGLDCYVLECGKVANGAMLVRWYVGVKDHLLHKIEWGILPGNPEIIKGIIIEAEKRGTTITDQAQADAWLAKLPKKEQKTVIDSITQRAMPTNKPIIEFWMMDYTEVKPGCWYPWRQGYVDYDVSNGVHVDYDNYEQPRVKNRREIRITDLTLDKPLPDALFTTKFPATATSPGTQKSTFVSLPDVDGKNLCGEIPLILGWNGQKMTVPGPLLWPAEARKTADYLDWQRKHDIRTLNFTDSAGRQWTAKVEGAASQEITVHRPDGTLLASATILATPSHWEFYDAPGKRILLKVTCDAEKSKAGEDTGRWSVANITTYYDPDGTERRWEITPHGQADLAKVIHGELVTLPSGHTYFANYAQPYFDPNQAYTPELESAAQKSNVQTIASGFLANAGAGNQDVVDRLILPGSPLAGKKCDALVPRNEGLNANHFDKIAIQGDRAQAVEKITEPRGVTEFRTWRLQQSNGYWLVADVDASKTSPAPAAAENPAKLKQAYEDYVNDNVPNAQAVGEFEAYIQEHPDTIFKAEIYFYIGCMYSCNVKEKFHEPGDTKKMNEYYGQAHAIWGRKFSYGNITAWLTLANLSSDVQFKIDFYQWLLDLPKATANDVYSVRDFDQTFNGRPAELTTAEKDEMIHFYIKANHQGDLAVAEANFLNNSAKSPAALAKLAKAFPQERLGIEAAKLLVDTATKSAITSPSTIPATQPATLKVLHSRDLSGTWKGERDGVTAKIEFSGVDDAQWRIEAPRAVINAGLKRIDNQQTGTVDLRMGCWMPASGKRGSEIIGTLSEDASGALFLSILPAAEQRESNYQPVSQIPLHKWTPKNPGEAPISRLTTLPVDNTTSATTAPAAQSLVTTTAPATQPASGSGEHGLASPAATTQYTVEIRNHLLRTTAGTSVDSSSTVHFKGRDRRKLGVNFKFSNANGSVDKAWAPLQSGPINASEFNFDVIAIGGKVRLTVAGQVAFADKIEFTFSEPLGVSATIASPSGPLDADHLHDSVMTAILAPPVQMPTITPAMREAADELGWVHYDIQELSGNAKGGEGPYERGNNDIHTSFDVNYQKGILCLANKNGPKTFLLLIANQGANETTSYNASTQTITRKLLKPRDLHRFDSPQLVGYLPEAWLQKLMKSDGKKYNVTSEKNPSTERYEIKANEPLPGIAPERWVLTLDSKTHLLQSLEIWMRDDETDNVAFDIWRWNFTYNVAAPQTDIYAMGAPRNAKVVDLRAAPPAAQPAATNKSPAPATRPAVPATNHAPQTYNGYLPPDFIEPNVWDNPIFGERSAATAPRHPPAAGSPSP